MPFGNPKLSMLSSSTICFFLRVLSLNYNFVYFFKDHVEGYLELSAKTKIYFATAVSMWDAEFYVKVDDDVHVNIGEEFIPNSRALLCFFFPSQQNILLFCSHFDMLRDQPVHALAFLISTIQLPFQMAYLELMAPGTVMHHMFKQILSNLLFLKQEIYLKSILI